MSSSKVLVAALLSAPGWPSVGWIVLGAGQVCVCGARSPGRSGFDMPDADRNGIKSMSPTLHVDGRLLVWG